MIDWLAESQTLPRYVVWALLLTHPATWAGALWAVVRERIPGAKQREKNTD